MAWDNDPYARSIIADISKLKPLGDFVLVKPFTLDEQLAMQDRLMAPSPIKMTSDGRYVSNRPRGLQYGKVIACGAGDRILCLVCQSCEKFQHRIERGQESKKWRCSECGGFDLVSGAGESPDTADIARASLDCRLGDVILFPRVPANEISINGEGFVMIHEEQHVWAVVELGEWITLPARDLAAFGRDGEAYTPLELTTA